MKKAVGMILTVVLLIGLSACGWRDSSNINLMEEEEGEKKVVNLFGPMEKSNPNADNVARTAH